MTKKSENYTVISTQSMDQPQLFMKIDKQLPKWIVSMALILYIQMALSNYFHISLYHCDKTESQFVIHPDSKNCVQPSSTIKISVEGFYYNFLFLFFYKKYAYNSYHV